MAAPPVHAVHASPVGDLIVVGDDGGPITGLYLSGQRHLPDLATLGVRDDSAHRAAREQLDEYFAGTRTEFSIPLAPRGATFRRRVWRLLSEIPYGATRSYGDLAAELGDPNLARAVGTANGRNPIAIVVPCHRVVGADGSLTGYAGGLDRKRFLLDHEARVAGTGSTLF